MAVDYWEQMETLAVDLQTTEKAGVLVDLVKGTVEFVGH